MNPDPVSRMVNMNAMPEIRDRFRDKEMEKVADGMKATVRVEAFSERLLHGHVKSVATVASQQDWSSADVKVYQTMIAIDESLEGLKPGMSAEVTIHVESAGEHVLTVPIPAIVGGAELGRTRKVFVKTDDDQIVEREVLVGLSNASSVEIKDGLKEGDEVVMNPKVLLGDKAKTRQANDTERGAATGGDGEGRPKGRGKGKGKMGGPPANGLPGDDGPGPGGYPKSGPPGAGAGPPAGRGGLAK
jgi:hypothetical protein